MLTVRAIIAVNRLYAVVVPLCCFCIENCITRAAVPVHSAFCSEMVVSTFNVQL